MGKMIIARALGITGNVKIRSYHQITADRAVVCIQTSDNMLYYLDEALIEILEVAE